MPHRKVFSSGSLPFLCPSAKFFSPFDLPDFQKRRRHPQIHVDVLLPPMAAFSHPSSAVAPLNPPHSSQKLSSGGVSLGLSVFGVRPPSPFCFLCPCPTTENGASKYALGTVLPRKSLLLPSSVVVVLYFMTTGNTFSSAFSFFFLHAHLDGGFLHPPQP